MLALARLEGRCSWQTAGDDRHGRAGSAASLLKCHGVAAGICGAGLEPGDCEGKAAEVALSWRHGASPSPISPSSSLGAVFQAVPTFPVSSSGWAPPKHMNCHVPWCRADSRALCRAPSSAGCSARIPVWVCGLGGGSGNSLSTRTVQRAAGPGVSRRAQLLLCLQQIAALTETNRADSAQHPPHLPAHAARVTHCSQAAGAEAGLCKAPRMSVSVRFQPCSRCGFIA